MTMLIATHELAFARDVADHRLLPRRRPDPRAGAAVDQLVAPEQERTRQFLRRVLPPTG